jgi:hypothetical protein
MAGRIGRQPRNLEARGTWTIETVCGCRWKSCGAMRRGTLGMIDALGFKGIWKRVDPDLQ